MREVLIFPFWSYEVETLCTFNLYNVCISYSSPGFIWIWDLKWKKMFKQFCSDYNLVLKNCFFLQIFYRRTKPQLKSFDFHKHFDHLLFWPQKKFKFGLYNFKIKMYFLTGPLHQIYINRWHFRLFLKTCPTPFV